MRWTVRNTWSEGELDIREKHFDIERSLRIFALTFFVCVAVIGFAAYHSGGLEPLGILWRSLAIAAAVAIGAGWLTLEVSTYAGDGEDAGEPVSADRSGHSLEEQGITAKLLELIALGERYGNTFSLALVGVDYLADVEEEYSRNATDRLLKRVAGVLAHTLRMPDRVGHFARGSYLVVLPETRLPGAVRIAERLRAAVAGLDIAVSPRLHVHTTASVGVTSFHRGDDLRGLLERVERTLRTARQQGRNRVLSDPACGT